MGRPSFDFQRDLGKHYPEAVDGLLLAGRHGVSRAGHQVFGLIGVPTAAAQHPEHAGAELGVFVLDPLLDVAAQIIDPEVVRRKRTHRRGKGVAIVVTGNRALVLHAGPAGRRHVGEIADFFAVGPTDAPRIDPLFAGIAPAGADAFLSAELKHSVARYSPLPCIEATHYALEAPAMRRLALRKNWQYIDDPPKILSIK